MGQIQKSEGANVIYKISKMEFNDSILKHKKSIIFGLIILILLFGGVFFGVKYFSQLNEIEGLQKELAVRQTNERVVNFLAVFIQKVLRAEKEVSFEDRLKLENTIRDINDPEILSEWEKFTGSTNEFQIQEGVKDLLEVLVKKISY